MAKSKFNKLDEPLKNKAKLEGQVEWEKYTHKDSFSYLCEIKGDEDNEKNYFCE